MIRVINLLSCRWASSVPIVLFSNMRKVTGILKLHPCRRKGRRLGWGCRLSHARLQRIIPNFVPVPIIFHGQRTNVFSYVFRFSINDKYYVIELLCLWWNSSTSNATRPPFFLIAANALPLFRLYHSFLDDLWRSSQQDNGVSARWKPASLHPWQPTLTAFRTGYLNSTFSFTGRRTLSLSPLKAAITSLNLGVTMLT